jgi:hypothetical protein
MSEVLLPVARNWLVVPEILPKQYMSVNDARCIRHDARAKQPAQRNEIYAKLHKARTQLEYLRQV